MRRAPCWRTDFPACRCMEILRQYVSRQYRTRRSTVYTLSIPGVKRAQKGAEKAPEPGAQNAQKTTPHEVPPTPAPNAPRTVTEPITPLPPQSGGKKKHSREEETNPRRVGTNPRAARGGTDQEGKKWAIRLRSFAEKGFWLPAWGPVPGVAGCMAPPEVLNAYR